MSGQGTVPPGPQFGPSVSVMEPPAQANDVAAPLVYKNRLQEYTQRSALPFPSYETVNEGSQHAPMFRSTVLVDGAHYTSPNTFRHRRAAEQDAARVALDAIVQKIKDEGCPLFGEDTIFCKSILNEYAVKMNLEKPAYKTIQEEGLLPVFVSSLVFNGVTYTGKAGRNKKEAEQLAARAVILSILGNSDSGISMSEIIKSKFKLYNVFQKDNDSHNSHNAGVPGAANVGTAVGFGVANVGTGSGFGAANMGSGSGFGTTNVGSGSGFGTANAGTRSGSGTANVGTGSGSGTANAGTGSGLGAANAGTGSGLVAANAGTGSGFGAVNAGTGSGFGAENAGTGLGFWAANVGSGSGFGAENVGTGLGLSAANVGTGLSLSAANVGTGSGFGDANVGTGLGLGGANVGTGSGFGNANVGTGVGFGAANVGTGLGFHACKEKEPEVTRSTTAISQACLGQVTNVPKYQPFEEFKTPEIKPSSAANTAPTEFVPPVHERPPNADSGSARKRRRKNKKAKKQVQVDAMLPVAGQVPACSVAQ